MLKSMTGFGLSKGQQNGYSVAVELKSLNSKFLDAQIRIPKNFLDKELEIRGLLTKGLNRGKVNLSIELTTDTVAVEAQEVNQKLFNAYYKEYEGLADQVGASKDDLFRLALHSPEVIAPQVIDEAAINEQWAFIQLHLAKAIEALGEFRAQEGASLEHELKSYIANIGNYLKEIEEHDPERVKVVKERIQKHQQDLSTSDEFDENRFEQEMIYYIEKFDISEEIVRLTNHLSYFNEVMAEQQSQGKKLGFVSQEIGREINTIGSKANYAPVQKLVVCMKDDLEKIKEQLLNII
ncbi:YicC/YloC family endoribonuclease [Roseivirga misakiensis]|uniref:YicC family protein n=1 Tax=Roseivirga misakiensis TaxID=1563681 RepID=A0A1E5T295_9BACT|nr:YicC/YloC family endoribonuclease [Roseivirga misakiensis]OEK05481.1 YicC family protein [Roseivirga misakiensis]